MTTPPPPSPMPRSADEARRVPAGTPVHTAWGWVTAWVPVASVAASAVSLWLMSGPMLAYTRHIAELSLVASTGTRVQSGAVFAIMADAMPGIIAASLVGTLLGWALYALAIVAGYLDHRQLGRLGYPRRFPWAWSFLPPVYPIGRGVVVRRQAGAGSATMWIAIVATVASILLSLGWSIWLVSAMFDAMRAGLGSVA